MKKKLITLAICTITIFTGCKVREKCEEHKKEIEDIVTPDMCKKNETTKNTYHWTESHIR